MRRIVLSTVAIALIATSASPAVAGGSRHHVPKAPQATSEPFRNTVAQPPQPAWPYSGWSAPAGR